MNPENEGINLEELIALPINFVGTPGRASRKIAFISNRTERMSSETGKERGRRL